MGERGKPVLVAIDKAVTVFFEIMRIIVQVAPIGAFGAMAFTKLAENKCHLIGKARTILWCQSRNLG